MASGRSLENPQKVPPEDTWKPGDPVHPAPSPDVCSFCHEHRPMEMALHAGHTHVCQDCAGEAS